MQCYKNPILSVLLKQEYDHNNQVENSLHKHRCYDNSNTFLCACRTLVQFREKMCRVETRRISSVQLICRMCSHCIRLRSCCIQCFIYIFQAKKKLWNSVENSTKENVPKMKPILQTKWESLEFQLGILIQLHTQSAQFCPLYPLFSIPNSDILPDQFPSFLWYYIIFFLVINIKCHSSRGYLCLSILFFIFNNFLCNFFFQSCTHNILQLQSGS